MKIRKAVIPVAGLGTRFLPATKTIPKEMLPIVDKPSIQYIVEEAVQSGIEQIIFINARGKEAIEDHFDTHIEMETILKNRGNDLLLEEIQKLSRLVQIATIRQKVPLGLGHAILCAKDLVGQEPFAVMLGDDLVDSKVPCIQQLIHIFNEEKAFVSSLYGNKLYIVNPKTFLKTGEIQTGCSTEKMLVYYERIFICNWSGGNKVLVINGNIDQIIHTINVVKEPNSIVLDKNNKI